MKNKILVLGLITCLIFLSTFCVNISSFTCKERRSYALEGKGTELDPLLLRNMADVTELRNSRNFEQGREQYNYAGKWIRLMFNMNGGLGISYNGNFDGNGYTFYNVTSAVFVNVSGTIKNVKVDGVDIQSSGTGVIAGTSNGAAFINCHVKNGVMVGGTSSVGGIWGSGSGQAYDCSVVDLHISGRNIVGGIAGSGGSSVFENCFFKGVITAVSGQAPVTRTRDSQGNITGYMWRTGPMNDNPNPSFCIGGLAGTGGGSAVFQDCRVDATINTASYIESTIGGLAGTTGRTTVNCIVKADINAEYYVKDFYEQYCYPFEDTNGDGFILVEDTIIGGVLHLKDVSPNMNSCDLNIGGFFGTTVDGSTGASYFSIKNSVLLNTVLNGSTDHEDANLKVSYIANRHRQHDGGGRPAETFPDIDNVILLNEATLSESSTIPEVPLYYHNPRFITYAIPITDNNQNLHDCFTMCDASQFESNTMEIFSDTLGFDFENTWLPPADDEIDPLPTPLIGAYGRRLFLKAKEIGIAKIAETEVIDGQVTLKYTSQSISRVNTAIDSALPLLGFINTPFEKFVVAAENVRNAISVMVLLTDSSREALDIIGDFEILKEEYVLSGYQEMAGIVVVAKEVLARGYTVREYDNILYELRTGWASVYTYNTDALHSLVYWYFEHEHMFTKDSFASFVPFLDSAVHFMDTTYLVTIERVEYEYNIIKRAADMYLEVISTVYTPDKDLPFAYIRWGAIGLFTFSSLFIIIKKFSLEMFKRKKIARIKYTSNHSKETDQPIK